MASPDSFSLISDRQFNDMVHNALSFAREVLRTDPTDGFEPRIIVTRFGPDKEEEGMMAVFVEMDIERRYEILEAFGYKMGEEGHLVLAVIFVSEAWRASGELDDKGNAKVMPREAPDRQESICALGMCIDGRSAMSFLDVERDEQNNMVPGEIINVAYDPKTPDEARSPLCAAFFKGYRLGLSEMINQTIPADEARKRVNKMRSEATRAAERNASKLN